MKSARNHLPDFTGSLHAATSPRHSARALVPAYRSVRVSSVALPEYGIPRRCSAAGPRHPRRDGSSLRPLRRAVATLSGDTALRESLVRTALWHVSAQTRAGVVDELIEKHHPAVASVEDRRADDVTA